MRPALLLAAVVAIGCGAPGSTTRTVQRPKVIKLAPTWEPTEKPQRVRVTERARPVWLVEVEPYADSLRRLSIVVFAERKPWYRTFDVLAGLSLDDVKRMMAELAAVEKTCHQRAPTAGAMFPFELMNAAAQEPFGSIYIPRDLADHPDAWCYVAAQRIDLISQALARKSFLGPEIPADLYDRPPGADAVLALAFRDPAAFKAPILAEKSRWYRELGVTEPANMAAEVDARIALFHHQVEYLSRRRRLGGPKRFRDPQVERVAIAQLSREPGVMVRRVHLTSPYREIPEDNVRWRAGAIVIQRDRLPFCEQRSFTYTETREGARYRPSREIRLRDAEAFEPVACR